MSNPVSRRSMLQLLGIAAPTAALSLLAPEGAGAALMAPVAGARSGVIRSYGPNGTHWPNHTPWVGDRAPRIIEVACTWGAIGAAIAAVTPAQAAAGVHIKVRPGTLPGSGSSSGSKPMLQNVGKTTWAQNVLVSPRDGWNTVNIRSPARLFNVAGVTFARINGVDVLLTNCNRTAWAHSKMTRGFKMTSSYSATTRECSAYEIVLPNARTADGDPMGYGTGDKCALVDSVWDGCYAAPVFRRIGASGHLDTLQMYGGGWYRGLTIRDSTFFGSLNCALQVGGARADDPQLGTPFLTIDHSIVTSQATAIRARYALPRGASMPSFTQAINGIGEPGQLFAKDSLIFGSMYRTSWGTVTDTSVSHHPALDENAVASGGWTYDSSMDDWAAAEFDSLISTPTDAFLAAIWR